MQGGIGKTLPKHCRGVSAENSKFVLRAEVICDLNLWIWSFQFGLRGVQNDLNILSVSEHLAKVLARQFPPVAPQYMVSGENFRWFYYIADGIYPPWKVFCGMIDEAELNKEKVFVEAQEGVQKCVERVFGVLFTQFKILFVPSQHDVMM